MSCPAAIRDHDELQLCLCRQQRRLDERGAGGVGLQGANKEWLKRERLGCGRLNLLACRKREKLNSSSCLRGKEEMRKEGQGCVFIQACLLVKK